MPGHVFQIFRASVMRLDTWLMISRAAGIIFATAIQADKIKFIS
jgi:hypothetical protein